MIRVSPSGMFTFIANEMKKKITPEAFNEDPLNEVLGYRAEAAVLTVVCVVDIGAASIFTDIACSSQTMSSDDAQRLLDEHHAINERDRQTG